MKNLPITANMQVADVIHINYQLLPVIGRFGLVPGFGNKTINELCSDYNIDTLFFLEIINSYHNADYFSESQFGDYSLSLVVEYLTKTHHYYLDAKIPELENIVNNIIRLSNSETKTHNRLIANFFEEYKNELKRHFAYEEKYIFSYSATLENAYNKGIATPKMILKKKRVDFINQNKDHHQLEEKLFDLKNLIIRHFPSSGSNIAIKRLIPELFSLEEDLNDHSRIEDKVLIPKIIQLEEKIIAQNDKT
jgi:regulator of cell morphogenesis and NO signaling